MHTPSYVVMRFVGWKACGVHQDCAICDHFMIACPGFLNAKGRKTGSQKGTCYNFTDVTFWRSTCPSFTDYFYLSIAHQFLPSSYISHNICCDLIICVFASAYLLSKPFLYRIYYVSAAVWCRPVQNPLAPTTRRPDLEFHWSSFIGSRGWRSRWLAHRYRNYTSHSPYLL